MKELYIEMEVMMTNGLVVLGGSVLENLIYSHLGYW